ncbi:MmcQ/YjbR family DNA-binding protein [Kribbella sp. NPDC054772]
MDAAAVVKVMVGLPGAEEQEGWAGQPVFKVKNKSFAYLSEDQTRMHLKALREEQEALVAEDPAVYSASWAGGRFAWLLVELEPADEEELRELITEAWRLTAPKYLIAQLTPGAGA